VRGRGVTRPLCRAGSSHPIKSSASHFQAAAGRARKAGGIKTTIHIVSILVPLFLFLLSSNSGNNQQTPGSTILMTLIITFFTFLAGGFDWRAEKVSLVRSLLFFIFSGLLFGLILIGLWFVIRWVIAQIFRLPFTNVKGKLLAP
jgi:O-antigen ligase